MAGRGKTYIPDEPGTNGKARESSGGGRTPPHDEAAERGVLGSLMLAPYYMDEVWNRLSPEDFYNPLRSQAFLAMRNIHAAGRKIDPTLILDRMTRAGAERETAEIELVECFDHEPHAENIFRYAEIVRELATRRRIIHLSTDAIREAMEVGCEAKELLGRLESTIFDLTAVRHQEEMHRLEDVVRSKSKQLKNKKKREPGLKFGLCELDGMLGGLERGHLNLIAALTSVGKTALATTFVAHQLVTTDSAGYFCSMEMNEVEVMERIAANVAEVDYRRFRDNELTEAEQLRFDVAEAKLMESSRLFIDHAGTRTVQEVVSMARKAKRTFGRLDYVIIDYLQLLDSEKTRASTEEQLSDIARRLKVSAKELEVPLIVLAQLNRQAEEGRPKLRHLRGSGAIEHAADKVILIERNTVAGEAANAQAVFYVDKVRHGQTGECNVAFFGHYQRFQTYVENEEQSRDRQREAF